MALNYKKILSDDASFMLLRANPKLTGNVKLAVDSRGRLWLNSIDANDELAKNRYKRFPVNPDIEHRRNVYKFFDNGNTPNSVVFDQRVNVKQDEVSRKLEDQYDFSDYFAGVKFLPSRFYGERYSYFAPLHLRRQLPEFFVVFKIPGASNYDPETSMQKYPFDNGEYMYDMLKSATVKSIYDMRDNTRLGKYIRNVINDPNYPASPLLVNFRGDALTYYRGISVQSGAYTSKGEDLGFLFEDDVPLKQFERYVTEGFERNSIIYPGILNMEFLFEDEFDDYEFYRYFGMYVSKVELDTLRVDIDKLQTELRNYAGLGNRPTGSIRVDELEETPVDVVNPGGVEIPVTGGRGIYDDMAFGRDNLSISYIEDKNGGIYPCTRPDAFATSGSPGELTRIRLSDAELRISDFYGPGETFLQENGNCLFTPGRSFVEVKFLDDLNDHDTIRIYHPSGSHVNGAGEAYDDFVGMYNGLVDEPGDYYFYDGTREEPGSPSAGTGNLYYFNGGKGNDGEAATAFATLVNLMPGNFFTAYSAAGTTVVKLDNTGMHDSKFRVEVISLFDYDKLAVNEVTGSDLDGRVTDFIGGSDGLNRLYAKYAFYDTILQNKDDLVVKAEGGWDVIASVYKYADAVNEDAFSDRASAGAALGEYNDGIVITLADEDAIPYVNKSNYLIKKKYYPKFGLLSIYPIRDFDYDFYSSRYTEKLPVWELYKHFYLPPDRGLMEYGYTYTVVGTGVITYDGIDYRVPKLVLGSPEEVNISMDTADSPRSYTVKSGDAFLIYKSHADKQLAINDEDGGIPGFGGFFTIRDNYERTVDNQSTVFQRRDKFIYNQLSTEYHYYRENYAKDFAYTSKLNPYIAKWGYVGGRDARDNPYRFNAMSAMGMNNLSPDLRRVTPDPSRMTHEWYYLMSDYSEFLRDEGTLGLNYSYFQDPLDLSALLSDESAFLDYFVYTPRDVGGNPIEREQFRFSTIRYNRDTDFNETMFRGMKIRFKEVSNANILGADGKPLYKEGSRRFDGYRFTALLRPIEEDIDDPDSPPVEMRMIEKREYGFVLMLIDVRISSLANVDAGLSDPDDDFRVTGSNFRGLEGSPADYRYRKIDGEYRVAFNESGVGDLGYAFIYSAANKKYGNKTGLYSNIRLASRLDFNAFPDLVGGVSRYAPTLAAPGYANYDYNLLDEVSAIGQDNLILMRDNDQGKEYFVHLSSDPAGSYTSAIRQVQQDKLVFGVSSGETLFYRDVDTGLIYAQAGDFGTGYYAGKVFKQLSGGRSYYAKLFSKISAAQIKRYINDFDPVIEYRTHVSGDAFSDGEFYAEVEEPVFYRKRNVIVPVPDDKPGRFASTDVVGYKYTRVPIQGSYGLNRYNGGYEPVFRDVFGFKPVFELPEAFGEDIEFANVTFNPDVSDFARIPNFWSLKVSNKKILALQGDDKFDPVYELIDEIAVARSGFDVLSSSWEYGFHRRYGTKNTFERLHGFLRVGEDFNTAAKILSTPATVILNDYAGEAADDINDVDLGDHEIVYQEGEGAWTGFINVSNMLLRYFNESGIAGAFEGCVDGAYLEGFTVQEYVDQYVRTNILPLYAVSGIDVYKKRLAGMSGAFSVDVVPIPDKGDAGYALDRNTTVTRVSPLLYKFTINKNVNAGTAVSPVIKIKFI